VRGTVVTIPSVGSRAEFEQWLPSVAGKFVALSQLQRSCRPDNNWQEFATEESLERIRADRQQDQRDWSERIRRTGHAGRELAHALEEAGAAGILTSIWPNGWGVQRVFAAQTEQIPTVGIGCEDYGLVFRLAENNQGPVLEVMAEAEFLGEAPVSNTIAEVRGGELSDEYVMLSAHFDSWDGGSGATDNGTGTITMLEAMRILRATYPSPRRTIVVGHWSGEEQGLNGSTGFAAQNPQIVEGLQALFNQDNGTGRIVRLSAQGYTQAGAHFARWFSMMPGELTDPIQFSYPGTPSGGGSDHASFVCHGAPAFSLGALNWSYGSQTWHTDGDTFDKIVFDDLRHNATLTAMLVYLASEDPDRISRDRRDVLPPSGQTGQPGQWPGCRSVRTWGGYTGR
jgi:hypothetical protein